MMGSPKNVQINLQTLRIVYVCNEMRRRRCGLIVCRDEVLRSANNLAAELEAMTERNLNHWRRVTENHSLVFEHTAPVGKGCRDKTQLREDASVLSACEVS